MSTSQPTTTSSPPIKNFRSGAVQAAVWKNKTDRGSFLSVTLSRSYKQGTAWKSTDSFGARDLLDLRRVIVAAEQFVAEQPI